MKKIERLIPLMVLAAGLASYYNCLPNEFIFDDRPYIQENPHIRSLWPPGEILAHSTRPAINFSLAVNYALGGLNPWGYHAVNVVIHLLAGLLLYGVVRRSMQAQQIHWKWAGSAPWLAAIVAALWVVHPLQTESVTYIWQRCESLMGLFYLLTLYCVIRSNKSPHSIWWAVGAVVSCALGMASKEVMATAPVAVLLYDRVFLAKSWKEVGRRRWGLYAGLAGTWLILVMLITHGAARTGVYMPTADIAYKGIQPWHYLLTQAGVIVHYLRLALWPDRLCLVYGSGWPVARTVAEVLPALIVVGGLLLLTAWAWWRKPALAFVGTWFFLILAPTSSVVPIMDVAYEHRMYLSLAAVIVLGVVAAVTLLERLSDGQRQLKWGAGAAALVLIITLASLTARRNEDYRSSLTIWQDTVQKTPRNAEAHYALGGALQSLRRIDEAMQHYQEALRLKPTYEDAHNNLGYILQDLGRHDKAMEHFQEALKYNPNYAEAHNNWGTALQGLGRTDEATDHFREAVRLKPDYSRARSNLGVALQSQGRSEEAAVQLREALRLDPEYAKAHVNLGVVLASVGRLNEAAAECQEALRLQPDLAAAHVCLAWVLLQQGRPEQAVAILEEVLRREPGNRQASDQLQKARALMAQPVPPPGK